MNANVAEDGPVDQKQQTLAPTILLPRWIPFAQTTLLDQKQTTRRRSSMNGPYAGGSAGKKRGRPIKYRTPEDREEAKLKYRQTQKRRKYEKKLRTQAEQERLQQQPQQPGPVVTTYAFEQPQYQDYPPSVEGARANDNTGLVDLVNDFQMLQNYAWDDMLIQQQQQAGSALFSSDELSSLELYQTEPPIDFVQEGCISSNSIASVADQRNSTSHETNSEDLETDDNNSVIPALLADAPVSNWTTNQVGWFIRNTLNPKSSLLFVKQKLTGATFVKMGVKDFVSLGMPQQDAEEMHQILKCLLEDIIKDKTLLELHKPRAHTSSSLSSSSSSSSLQTENKTI